MILVAPEFGVAIAFDGYFQAKGAVRAARPKLHSSDQVLTLIPGFYANMGGFARMAPPDASLSDSGQGLSGMPDQCPTKKPTLYCLTLKDYGQYILSHLCEGYNPRTCIASHELQASDITSSYMSC
jgi:hypothetical protein